jgi:hypothetical protein
MRRPKTADATAEGKRRASVCRELSVTYGVSYRLDRRAGHARFDVAVSSCYGQELKRYHLDSPSRSSLEPNVKPHPS